VRYSAVIILLVFFFAPAIACADGEDGLGNLLGRNTDETMISRPGCGTSTGDITTENYTKLTGEEKIEVVKKLIETYKIRKGIIIKSPAELYVILLDDAIERNPVFVDMPLEQVFENACMEIDDFEAE